MDGFRTPAQRPRASSSRSRRTIPTPPSRDGAAQRPRASSSRSRSTRSRPGRSTRCSTPEGVIVSVTKETRSHTGIYGAAQRPRASSSRSPAVLPQDAPDVRAAQRPRASSSRSPRPGGGSSARTTLLNARGRHRLGHGLGPGNAAILKSCSTPEGVIVSVTSRSRPPPPTGCSAQRPRASSSRSPGPPPSPTASITTAQRPRASSSRSLAVIPRREVLDLCSTPEGVIVSVTRLDARGGPDRLAAQRPRASSSRSRSRATRSGPRASTAQRPRASSSRSPPSGSRRTGTRRLLNARGRHRLGHTPLRVAPAMTALTSCSTPEGVIVSVTKNRNGATARVDLCSTPEGVIVSVTRAGLGAAGGDRAAQRPRASSSRSPSAYRAFAVDVLCSTPEGVIVSVTRSRGSPPGPTPSAQRPRASSSRSPARPGACRSAPWSLLNARGRHRLGHDERVPGGRPADVCSTPEGVIVSVTVTIVGGQARAEFCSTPEGVIVSVTRNRYI